MKELATEITAKGFDYTQVAREGNVAVYAQSFHGGKRVFAYEVIFVQSHNGYTLGGKDYPPSEFYPSDAQWGKKGWSYGGDNAKERALTRMRELIDTK